MKKAFILLMGLFSPAPDTIMANRPINKINVLFIAKIFDVNYRAQNYKKEKHNPSP